MPDDSLLEQYDLGDTEEGLYAGSVAVTPRPNQQRPAGIPATKAIPPKDPVTGKFLPAQAQPSAPNAQRQEPSEEPLQQTHSRNLLRRAVETGFTDTEIDSTPSEELEERIYSRQKEAIARAANSPQPNLSAREQVQSPVQDEVVEPEPQYPEIDKVLDPEIAAPLKAQLTAQLKQLKAMEAKLIASEAREKQREENYQRQSRNQAIDKMFSKHAHFVGAQSVSEMHPEDPNLAKREAVIALAIRDKSKRSDQEKIDHAISQLFGAAQEPEVETPTRQVPTRQGQRPTPQEFANGGIPRPTQRKPAPELNGVVRARKAVEERLAQLQEPGSNGTVDYDDFPE